MYPALVPGVTTTGAATNGKAMPMRAASTDSLKLWRMDISRPLIDAQKLFRNALLTRSGQVARALRATVHVAQRN